MKRFLATAILLLASQASAQTFNFASPTEVTGVTEVSYAYLAYLDAVDSPRLSCWKNQGSLLQKGCAGLIAPTVQVKTLGAKGQKILFSSPATYDVHELFIDRGPDFGFDPNPDWSISFGCVVDTEELGGGPVGNNRLITINDGATDVDVRCNTGDLFVGGLFGKVCAVISPGDCGRFEGDDLGGTWPEMKQIVATKGF